MDLLEWERFGYRQGLSRQEIEQMSLREYVLRRQARMRSHVETLRLKTLPIVNTWTEDPVTAEDFFGGTRAMSEDEKEELKAFCYEVEQETDLVDDWSLVHKQLS